jgi:hypothetical protein
LLLAGAVISTLPQFAKLLHIIETYPDLHFEKLPT